ncbi:MAG: erythromycin esterase family protein [Pedobacter sp.]|nr:MAG: erythromycin esterase family protein [Pedobacter sp.]
MKHRTYRILAAVTLILIGSKTIQAQQNPEKEIRTNTTSALSLNSYEAFKKSIKPLISEMSGKRIVALGEGTHGTSEFYKVRYWITRLLVEEKGFNHVAFENDFSDGWFLNKALDTTTNLRALMQKHLLSIWQNEETRELLEWVRKYNNTHSKKITIDGLDYVFLSPDVNLLRELLKNNTAPSLSNVLNKLEAAANFQDGEWHGMNIKGFKSKWNELLASSKNGYSMADSLEKNINSLKLPSENKSAAMLAILNLKQGFAPFHPKASQASRDSIMAENAGLILQEPGSKMIIWAHEAHLAKTAIYNNAVGGTGGYLLRQFPGNYFVLGTGTATGTFAATTEPRDTYTNPMASYSLKIPFKDSWEELLNTVPKPAFYFYPKTLNPFRAVKQMRFIGYGPEIGSKVYDKTNISDLFDAFIFIKETRAATPLK